MNESLEELSNAFNKGNVFNALKALRDEEISLDELLEVCKPQKGGAAIAEPTKVVNGETLYWDRLSETHMPEADMTFSNGKCKYVSLIGSKVQYRINKAAKELGEKALRAYVDGDLAKGGKFNAEAQKLKAMAEDKTMYTMEAMTVGVSAKYNPEINLQANDDIC